MPDEWEYPWYAAWDLAFHMLPLALVDPDVRQGPAAAVLPRVVHAPERSAARVRVGVRRREPAGARVGGVAGLQDRRRRARASKDTRVPRADLPQAAHQLRLVGEPQGRRRAATSSRAASSGSTTSGCSTAPRPLPDGGRLAAVRRHELDGDVLPQHARDRPRARAARTARTRTSRPSSSSTSCTSPTRPTTWAATACRCGTTTTASSTTCSRSATRRIPLKVRSFVGLIPLFAVETIEPEGVRACCPTSPSA